MKRLLLLGAIMLFFKPVASALKADVSANTAPAYAWEKFEIRVSGDFGEINTYDYNRISVKAFFKNPSGIEKEVDGFYIQDFTYDRDTDAYTPGTGMFKIRFAFNRTGVWSYGVKIFEKNKPVYVSPVKKIKVEKPRGKRGFVRVSPVDPLFMEYDNKDPFFAIGANVCWWREKCVPDYSGWIKKLAENGANTIRIWMAPWSFGIEWAGPIGNYGHRQKQAYMLDQVMEIAENYNMQVELCLVPHGELSTSANPEWLNNPYNFINDGLLNKPSEFFTDPVAKKAFKNRLRYIIARWGYSTSILSWELFNEVDLTDDYDSAGSAAWHKEMAAFIKSYDVNKHFVTTSFSNRFQDPAVWALDGIDFTQTHSYEMKDEADKIYEICTARLEDFPKPHIVGEFGIDTGKDIVKEGADRDGVCLHNALWAGALTLSFGAPLPWYWDWYIDDYNLYYHFSPLAEFVKGINWAREDLTEIKNRQVFFRNPEGRKGGDVVFYPGDAWEKPKKNVFTVKADGSMVNEDFLSAYLFGSGKADLKNDPVIAFKNEQPVRFVIKLCMVSDDNELTAEINGRGVMAVSVCAKDFDTKKYFEEWKIYQADINKEFVLEMPEGDNEILLSNKGRDWMKVEYIKVENFLNARIAPVFVSGVQGPASAYLWVKSSDYGWLKGPGTVIKDAYIDVLDLNPGRYVVTFVETYTGSVIKEREDIVEKEEPLRLDLPEFSKDIAIKIRKYKK
jgi:hypothetical protein